MKNWEKIKQYYKKIKQFTINHAYSLILSVGSLIYGLQLIRYPQILTNFSVYQNIVNVFNPRYVGLVFILLGILKLVGLIFDYQKLKHYSLVGFTYVWSFFSLSFLLSQPPNTVWIFALIMTVLSISISTRGDFRR